MLISWDIFSNLAEIAALQINSLQRKYKPRTPPEGYTLEYRKSLIRDIVDILAIVGTASAGLRTGAVDHG
jgi:hypothetical protein